MNVLATLSEPGPGGTCRVCASKLREGSLSCSVCGAVYGEANRCPHCRAVAGVDASSRPGRCRICGGPRLLVDDARAIRSGREIPLLLRHRRAIRAARALRFGALLAAGLAALTLGLAIVTMAAAPAAPLAVLTCVAVLLLLGFAGLLERRARVEGRNAETSLQEAELIAAADVSSSHAGELSAASLARVLHIEEARAEVLLAELSLQDYLGAHVTPAGAVSFPSPRTRLATEGAGTTLVAEESAEVATESIPRTVRGDDVRRG